MVFQRKTAADHGQPFAHAEQPDAHALANRRRAAAAVVGNRKIQRSATAAQAHPAVAGLAVADGIGQRLLYDAVKDQPDRRRHRRQDGRQLEIKVDAGLALLPAVEQFVQRILEVEAIKAMRPKALENAAQLRADREAKDAFESLSPSQRREYARWVSEAKLPQTRQRRSVAATEHLKAGVRRPQSA